MDGNYRTGQNGQSTQGGTGYQSNQYGTYSEYTATSQYQAPAEKEKPNGQQIAGLVCGIAGIVLGCCYGGGFLFGVAGLICSIIGNKKGKTKIGTAGFICSIVGMVVSVIVGAISTVVFLLPAIASMSY